MQYISVFCAGESSRTSSLNEKRCYEREENSFCYLITTRKTTSLEQKMFAKDTNINNDDEMNYRGL